MKKILTVICMLMLATGCVNNNEAKIDALNERVQALYVDEAKSALRPEIIEQDLQSIQEALKDITDEAYTAAVMKELQQVETLLLMGADISRALPAERLYQPEDIGKIDDLIKTLKQTDAPPAASMIVNLQEERAIVEQFLTGLNKAEQVLLSYNRVMQDGYKVIDELNAALPSIPSAIAQAEWQKRIDQLSFFAAAFTDVQASTSLDFDYSDLSAPAFSRLLEDIRTRNEQLYQEMKPVFTASLALAKVYFNGQVTEGTTAQDLLEIESLIANINTAELRTNLKQKLDEARQRLATELVPVEEPKPQGNFYSEQNDEYVLKSILAMAKANYSGAEPLKLKVLESTKAKISVQVYAEFSDHDTLVGSFDYDRAANSVTDLSSGSVMQLPSN